MQSRILIIDDESSICVSLSLALQPDYEAAWETDPIMGLERLRAESFDLVLLDLVIGEYDGLEILREIRKIDPRVTVIMMTAYGSIRSSVSAMKQGAFTYLTKPLDLEELQIYMRQALEFRALNDSVAYLNEQLRDQAQAGALVGTSPAMRSVIRMIEKFRDADANVLISGESGTGKSLVAQTLHFQGKRKHFVTINCSAVEEDRLEEEFFGHKSGAYLGATHDRRGKLDYADQGTLLLDGISDMPPAFQAKLLRTLEEKAFTPIGGRELRRFDTRIIATTNRGLNAMVEEGSFRRDLLYRLNTLEIELPPLRERREDIPLLCKHFIQRSSTLQGKVRRLRGITPEAQELLNAHNYPGNVRELANVIEYAGLVANDEWIRVKDLPYRVTEAAPNADEPEKLLSGKTLQELERMAILASYRRNGGKRKLIAAELGISERGLWNKLKEYDQA
ncbi:MAG: Transcriptional regulatory protein ZraR [Firmicutes bacterium ADurb.Bin248]|nr:MAG: Transcriptional regulatory protein ZraR [Firmicutes bacterium ADurb.Bin248]HOG00459.1 sigma-54 dependent transcriptional regulator [Clostridia bacterium]HPK16355.1 sigma-54 dependent transcriptional regulator [Clostridia bacterium]